VHNFHAVRIRRGHVGCFRVLLPLVVTRVGLLAGIFFFLGLVFLLVSLPGSVAVVFACTFFVSFPGLVAAVMSRTSVVTLPGLFATVFSPVFF